MTEYNGNGTTDGTRFGLTQIGRRMNDPIIDSLKQYWDKLRAGRLAPYRSEIDPRQFEHTLENMFILETLADNSVRVRLAGMRLCEMMGMEVRGMSPQSFMMPEDRVRFDQLVMEVVEKPAVIEFALETVDYNGHSGTAYLVLMPLRNDFGEITRILGCISDGGARFEAPIRFRITQVTSEKISFSESDDREELAGFSEPGAGFAGKPARPNFTAIEGGQTEPGERNANRSHLRLVKG